MSIHPRSVVVAGVDGSPRSLAAARWAAEEAARRHQSVQLLYSAYLPLAAFSGYGYPVSEYPAELIENAGVHGRRLLDSTAAEISGSYPDLEVTTVMTSSDPRLALVEASVGAAMTVVGTLGSGRVQEVLLGSVALHVTAHGRSPVAVIPHDQDHRGGPVLVGVDGSAHSDAAVTFAFDEAAVRGVGVVAALIYDNWTRKGFARRPITFDVTESPEKQAVISEQLAGLAERYPDVEVHELIFRGQPADCLLKYAGHAPLEQQPQLIVVGSRGRGGLTGLLLGSTSHALIAHSGRPVVVVRPPG